MKKRLQRGDLSEQCDYDGCHEWDVTGHLRISS